MAKVEQTLERIRIEEPVSNTFHNLIQTLNVKIDSAARYGLYASDARSDGHDDCAELFDRLAGEERGAIDELRGCLRDHVDDM